MDAPATVFCSWTRRHYLEELVDIRTNQIISFRKNNLLLCAEIKGVQVSISPSPANLISTKLFLQLPPLGHIHETDTPPKSTAGHHAHTVFVEWGQESDK
jgi:hypothetical protein